MNLDNFIGYFENATRLYLPRDMMNVIYIYYQSHRQDRKQREFHWSRAQFCQAYLRNEDGLAEEIQLLANARATVRQTMLHEAQDTISDLKTQLAEARALAAVVA